MAKGRKTGGRRKEGLSTYILRLTGSSVELDLIRSYLTETSKQESLPMSRIALNVFLKECNHA
jgi:hypothetical protein